MQALEHWWRLQQHQMQYAAGAAHSGSEELELYSNNGCLYTPDSMTVVRK